MTGIIESFNQGFSGDETQGYSVAGLPVTCSHCGGEDFDEGSSQLNTAGMTFLNLDWANKSATVLTCKRCGHVDWFLQDPERR